jgi:putative effector of murein hydrolase LrgA (UPF0299 family)
MLAAFLTLLGCELLGELLRIALHLPVPGPVIGMLVLTIALAARRQKQDQTETPVPSALERTAGTLLDYMGLLFVPAGVGIISEIGLLRHEWLPILGGLIGSTVLSLGLTGIVMHHATRAKPPRSVRAPASCRAEAVS